MFCAVYSFYATRSDCGIKELLKCRLVKLVFHLNQQPSFIVGLLRCYLTTIVFDVFTFSDVLVFEHMQHKHLSKKNNCDKQRLFGVFVNLTETLGFLHVAYFIDFIARV